MGSFQEMFDKMVADHEARNPGQSEALPPAAPAPHFRELAPVDSGVASAHVQYAFNPYQGASSNGAYHLILDQPLHAARLHRNAGDALCKPRSKFWGLERGNDRQTATCSVCLERAARYSIAVRTPA
ncbi:hypothetical protein [Streptomyces sp. NPDC088178]|uniref:hypothetical protein n=1 Tax=Streptomyces sp. NPDC088178 TaxID=3365836 RepID=UPI0037F8B819